MNSLDLAYRFFERGIKGPGKVYVLCPEVYVKIQVTPHGGILINDYKSESYGQEGLDGMLRNMFADPEVLAFCMSSLEVKDLLECAGEFIFVEGKAYAYKQKDTRELALI